MICIIDEDNKQSFMYECTGSQKKRQIRATELAVKLAGIANPTHKGKITLNNREDAPDLIVVSFKRVA